MASDVVPRFWLSELLVPLSIPEISELLDWAVRIGPEGFSRAAELAAPLLAADIVERLVEERHRQAYYGRLFGLGCPGAALLGAAGSRSISFKEVMGSREVVERVAEELGEGELIAYVVNDDRGFYAFKVDFMGWKCTTSGRDMCCKEVEEQLGGLWLGRPGGHEVLLSPEHVRLNTGLMSEMEGEGWNPYSLLGLYVDVARAWGREVGAVVSDAVWWAAVVTRAALHEVERLSRVAAGGRAAAEVTEEAKQAALAAYNTVAGSPGRSWLGRRPSDEELLVAHTMKAYEKVVRPALRRGMAEVDVASNILDELVSNIVQLATKDRAIVEVLASLSEPG